MELIRQKIKEHKILLLDQYKEAIKHNFSSFKLNDEALEHPYISTCFNYPKLSQNLNLPSLLDRGEKKYIIESVEIPLETDPILQIIIDTDPDANEKQLRLKKKEEILRVSNSILTAINLIKETDKHFYDDIVDNLKMIVLFDASYSHNFTIDKIYDIIFFSPPKDASLIFFVDSLIHESSHNNLNLALYKFEDFFTINPLEEVFSSPFRKKDYKRGLFHVLHALFVIAKLCDFYDTLYQKAIFTENQNEILGRLLTNIKFLNLSIDEIDYEPFYTKNGLILLKYFKDMDKKMQDKYRKLIEKYILPNNCDNHIFSLDDFEKLNNL